jgi:hypothetical protein
MTVYFACIRKKVIHRKRFSQSKKLYYVIINRVRHLTDIHKIIYVSYLSKNSCCFILVNQIRTIAFAFWVPA